MKRSREWMALFVTATVGVASLFLLGCEIGDADSVVREVGINYSGFYVGDGGKLVSQQTGAQTTSLNLRQTGDQLEAVDNNGITFRGTIGSVVDDTASFVLDGSTTAGQAVTIDGTLTASGTEGTMRGTWIEPVIIGTVSGQATINPSPTNSPSPSTNTNTSVVITVKDGRSLGEDYRKLALWFMPGCESSAIL